MSASACLRISLDLSDEKLAKLESIGPLVAKVTAAFLESRWCWPKTFKLVSPFCFILIDPKATLLDVEALELLAQELQAKLFGSSDTGEVTLLVLESDAADSEAFTNMTHREVRDVFRQPIKTTPFGGRLLAVSSRSNSRETMRWRTLERDPRLQTTNSEATPTFDAELHGIYFTPRQTFVGSAVAAAFRGAPATFSLVDGVDRLPRDQAETFDMNSLQAGLRCLQTPHFTGVLFLPICFSSLMRRSTRVFYEDLLKALPYERRNQLAANVYDVPRSPNFWGLTQLHEVLTTHFASIDLQVEDPGFEIQNVPPGAVTSVTYRLPMTDERARLSAIRQFLKSRDSFKRLKVWPAITNVATSAELKMCLLERTPFITGRAVCGPTSALVGSQPCGIDALPLKGLNSTRDRPLEHGETN